MFVELREHEMRSNPCIIVGLQDCGQKVKKYKKQGGSRHAKK